MLFYDDALYIIITGTERFLATTPDTVVLSTVVSSGTVFKEVSVDSGQSKDTLILETDVALLNAVSIHSTVKFVIS